MAGCHNRDSNRIDSRIYIDGDTVDYIVRTTVDDDTFYIRKCFEFFNRNVVRIDFAIDTQRADCSCQHSVFMTAQIQDNNHILFHTILYFLLVLHYVYLKCGWNFTPTRLLRAVLS